MSEKRTFEMGSEIWIRFVAERGAFGIKVTTYFGEELIFYAQEVNLSSIFPAKPRPGITKMNVSTKGIIMRVSAPFVLSGEIDQRGIMEIRLHHQK